MTRDEIDTMWQQALQESVKDGETFTRYHFAELVAQAERQAIAEAEKQKPVIDKSAAIRIATALGWEPKREWVGLTDEECRKTYTTAMEAPVRDQVTVCRAIEAKLKDKNT